MIIYLNFIIPIIAVLVLLFIFNKEVTLFEGFLVFVVTAIVIVAFKYFSIANLTATAECLNSYVVRANYYEDWDEWISKTCYECVSRDTSGNCTQERSYDCSYREYHPSYWELVDNVGKIYGVPESKYRHLVQLWGKAKFQDLHRNYYHDDGDLWYVTYDNIFDHTYPLVNRGTYENRVKCSKSIFNFKTITLEEKSTYGLYDYPQINRYDYNPIIGFKDYNATKKLNYYNAHLGLYKQVHMLITVFKNKPYDAALYQESLWKGGNKNEFILCIGINDSNQIQWTKVISWTEIQDLKIGLESKVKKMPFELISIVDTMANNVKRQFIRKQFKDFNYLTVEPTTTAVIFSFIITLIVTIIMSIVVIKYDIKINSR